jgi:methyl-galactoside transport system permease protein
MEKGKFTPSSETEKKIEELVSLNSEIVAISLEISKLVARSPKKWKIASFKKEKGEASEKESADIAFKRAKLTELKKLRTEKINLLLPVIRNEFEGGFDEKFFTEIVNKEDGTVDREEMIKKAFLRNAYVLSYLGALGEATSYHLPIKERILNSKENFILKAFLKKYRYDEVTEKDKFLDETKRAKDSLVRSNKLREEGEYAIELLEEDIGELKRNKQIDKTARLARIKEDKDKINLARIHAKEAKNELSFLAKNYALKAEVEGKIRYAKEKAKYRETKVTARRKYRSTVDKIDREYRENVSKISSHLPILSEKETNLTEKARKKKVADAYKMELADEKFSRKNLLADNKRLYLDTVAKAKDNLRVTYLAKFNYLNNLHGGRNTYRERMEHKRRDFAYKFAISKFLLNNALYFIIIGFLIVGIIISIVEEGDIAHSLLTLGNLNMVLEQSSARMFLALGVAGAIVLAGTDLSVGRMLGMGGTITAILLHKGNNAISIFGLPNWNFDAWNPAARVILALLIATILTTIFSTIAGFFTAKFKVHPFISTLATQLIIYGLMMYATKGTNSGTIDPLFQNSLAPRLPRLFNFPSLFLYSIVGIAIMSFIWNRTKFGKNMFAVGGNAEAATVSGISVFWVTLGVFMLAGIYYGIGSFLETVRSSTSSANTGFGWELDAIAACVVGGVSFNGGIGKIRGVVFGVFIFTGLTYVLTFLGIDTNIQFIIKGIIILAAVTLDSIKYLKKK